MLILAATHRLSLVSYLSLNAGLKTVAMPDISTQCEEKNNTTSLQSIYFIFVISGTDLQCIYLTLIYIIPLTCHIIYPYFAICQDRLVSILA